jgi:P4 family phage/plasmid primase-like protien
MNSSARPTADLDTNGSAASVGLIIDAEQAEEWLARVLGPDNDIASVCASSRTIQLSADISGRPLDVLLPWSQIGEDERFLTLDRTVHADAVPRLYRVYDPYEIEVQDEVNTYLVPRISDVLALHAAGLRAICLGPDRKLDAAAMDELVRDGASEVRIWYENTKLGSMRAANHAELFRTHTRLTHKDEIRPAFLVWRVDWPKGSPDGCYPADVWRLKNYDRGAFNAALGRMSPTPLRQPDLATLQQTHASNDGESDLGNARRLVRAHGQDIRFEAGSGRWLVWDGRRWATDLDGQVTRYAKDVGKLVLAEASGERDDARRRRLVAHARSSESRSRIIAALGLAQTEPGVMIQPNALDNDSMLLNVANGTLDLRTGALRSHARSNIISKLVPVDYDPSAQCPLWLSFLDRVFDRDPELIAFMARFVGYTLTGRVDEQVMGILYGTGANGKSVFLETIRTLLADYAHVTEAATFVVTDANRVRNDVAALAGARFVSASEADKGARLSEALVKSVTGKERIRARFLYKESFEFMPAFKLFLAVNHRPVITGGDEGIWRRIMLVPFSVTIPAHERDFQLVEKLTAELPGILAWAVEGCLQWQKIGLAAPACVIAATQDYRDSSDVLASFIEDCCETGSGSAFSVSSTLLYAAWGKWCQEMGEEAGSQKSFSERLPAKGIGVRKSGGTKIRTGLRLRVEVASSAALMMAKLSGKKKSA